MKNIDFRQMAACLAVAAAFGLPAGAANAFVDYSSFFDPPDFEGTSGFRIAKLCLAGLDGYRDPTSPGCASNFKWTAAEVTLKDPNSPTEEKSRTFPYTDFGTINYIYVKGNQLAGVDSEPTMPVAIDGANPNFNGSWTIQFNFPPEFQINSSDALTPASNNLGTVSLCRFDNSDQCSVATVQYFKAQAVPEPGTLGLTLGALGMAWFVRRRKTG